MSDSPLERWYKTFGGKTNSQLTVSDIATAIRQDFEVERILPLAFDFFHDDPLAGDQYDGEIFFSLLQVSLDYWKNFPEMLIELRNHAVRAIEAEDVNGRITTSNWLEKVRSQLISEI